MNATYSFELFPPKSDAAKLQLIRTAKDLASLKPAYWSVTDGAGGIGPDGTVETADRIRNATGIDAAAHLTAINRSRSDISQFLDNCKNAGIKRIVALRGDVPNGGRPKVDAIASSISLIDQIKTEGDFDVSAGCYPEPHPDSQGASADLDHFKRKQDSGADRLITQYCFDTETIVRFRDAAVSHGIIIPIVPGVMPIKSYAGIKRFSKTCGASVPGWLERAFADIDENPSLHAMIAVSIAVQQCKALLAEGFAHQHIYCLNDAILSQAICRLIQAENPVNGEPATLAA